MPELGTPGGVDEAVPGVPKPCPPTPVGRPDGTYVPPFHPALPESTALIIAAGGGDEGSKWFVWWLGLSWLLAKVSEHKRAAVASA